MALFYRCPACRALELEERSDGMRCRACGHRQDAPTCWLCWDSQEIGYPDGGTVPCGCVAVVTHG